MRTLSGKEVDEERDPRTKTILLGAMQGRAIYLGTVSFKDKLARRAKNKRAKVARRAGR